MGNKVQAAIKVTKTAAAMATAARRAAEQVTLLFAGDRFSRRAEARLSAAYIISFVHYRFAVFFRLSARSCYLRDGLLTSEVSPNRNYFAALRARVVPRTINSQSRRREPLRAVALATDQVTAASLPANVEADLWK